MLVFIVFAKLAVFTYAASEFLVYPTILEERTTASNLVLQLNQDITLHLKRCSVLADEVLVATSTAEGNQMELVNTSGIQASLYHDTHHQSSVIVRARDGAAQVEGIINHKLRIKPVPEGKRSSQGEMLHKIYEVDVPTKIPINMGSGITRRNISQRELSYDRFAVEVHVISDSVHQKDFAKTEDLIAYFAVLLNGVNLRYVDMTKPRIKFMLVGITRSLDDAYASYLKPGILDMDKSLDGLFKFNARGRVPGRPDVVHLVTGQDMARFENGALDKEYTGLAYEGPPCTKRAVSLSEDIATSYKGVFIMAHELGHVMGSPHDETNRCPWSEGYLMSYVDGGVKKYRLSKCSEERIRDNLKYMPRRCVGILSQTTYMHRYNKFPGQKVSKKHYCQKRLKKYTTANDIFYEKPEDASKKCKMNCCFPVPPNLKNCLECNILDGMECAGGMTCKRGVCGEHAWP
ncbi:venom metalloproteinase antarease-like TtrivMP_A [Rhipicephalus sanguineus]|uniref:venom metalloproteinase antarease-like TtrivMP_A n=1 Tax=Rhipicephalus sanguineus TaxID=34632 RepID=UPI001893AB11|nr:venom metalloproteinase antarease-like TtrivMP_A [Rhipicephalus sanguineus]